MLDVTFFGVRGSTPCSCESQRRYGGNTSCVVIDSPGRDPVILDLGTGLRPYGLTQPKDGSFRATALLTHLHWDHVQGIPFFAPMLAAGSRLSVYGPRQADVSLDDAIRSFITPPYFPVGIDDLPADFHFTDVHADRFDVDGLSVSSAPVPHCGPTVGYRIESPDASVAYISDHQQPGVDNWEVTDAVLELCRDVDLLIHDSQFDRREFVARSTWGHCTADFAVEVAAQAGARRLALFHHDPSHDDARVEAMLDGAIARAAGTGIEQVFAASEGLTVSLGGRRTDADAIDCTDMAGSAGAVHGVGRRPARSIV